MKTARLLTAMAVMACSSLAAYSIQAIAFRDISAQEFRFAGLFKVFQATFRASPEANIQDPLAEFPKKLEFVYARKLKREQLIEAADKVLKNTYSDSDLNRVEEQIAAINDAYEDVDRGDRYTLRYDPTRRATALVKNGELVTEIPGDEFQRIYFSIWLGPESPFDFQPIT